MWHSSTRARGQQWLSVLTKEEVRVGFKALEELYNKEGKILTAAVLCVQSVCLAMTFVSVCGPVWVWNILSLS